MVELFWEPREEALKKITSIDGKTEMSKFESAFLCGFIKEFRPKKILEIGVAAGGTTAIILQCIDLLKMNEECEIISVDLNEKLYTNNTKDTGFLASALKSHLNKPINHRFLLGKVLAERMDDVGKNVDLVVLDTVHSLPGEVLDFPIILPLMSEKAHLILHDVAFHYYTPRDGISNQVLFDVCVGNKLLPIGLDNEKTTPMPNIAAIMINEDTNKYINSVFYSLTLPWAYIPDDAQLSSYRVAYEKYYSDELIQIYDMAISLNKNRINNKYRKIKLYLRNVQRNKLLRYILTVPTKIGK